MAKLLVTSRSYPPVITGSSIIVNNLFRSYQGSYVSVVGSLYEAKKDPTFTLDAPKLNLYFRNKLVQRVWERFQVHFINLLVFIIIRFAKENGCTHIFAVYPNGPMLLASFKAAKRLKLPYFVHMHDLWLENMRSGHPEGKISLKYEQKILESANKVFCMTEVQLDHLERKYNINACLLPHTVTPEAIFNGRDSIRPLSEKPKRLVYTGNISHSMNINAFKQLIQTIDLLPEDYEIHIYTSWDEGLMKQNNIFHPRMTLGWASKSEMPKILNDATVLFLPLSFFDCSKDEVDTVYATKTLDYLTSGTPILSYAPPTSYHTQHAREYCWAYVVDEPNPEKIAEAIITLSNHEDQVEKILECAMKEAERRNAAIQAANLLSIVNSTEK